MWPFAAAFRGASSVCVQETVVACFARDASLRPTAAALAAEWKGLTNFSAAAADTDGSTTADDDSELLAW